MATAQAEILAPQTHKWTVDEYYKMAEFGLFDDQRVELLEGVIVEMSAMGRPHVNTVRQVATVLETAFGTGWFVQTQAPLRFHKRSEPEPDLAVIAGQWEDYERDHPATAALIVEVSDTTLNKDRNFKGSLYAKAGIADYWIINLSKRQLEVYRHPLADADAIYGFSYGHSMILKPGETIAPLVKPKVLIAVSQLFPAKSRKEPS